MQVSRINKKGKTKEQLSKMVNGKSMAKASVWGTAVRFQEGKKKKDYGLKKTPSTMLLFTCTRYRKIAHYLYIPPPNSQRYFSKCIAQTSIL